jgi:hypothetical protein
MGAGTTGAATGNGRGHGNRRRSGRRRARLDAAKQVPALVFCERFSFSSDVYPIGFKYHRASSSYIFVPQYNAEADRGKLETNCHIRTAM